MRIKDCDTPAVVIEKAIMENNLRRAQDYADAHGMQLRPHIKTHKLPQIAARQIGMGAIGITCQKLGEAEIMADAGITDIFVPYNILGRAKLDRLHALHSRITISVSADSFETVSGYAGRFTDPAHPLPVLVECDTGAGRCGVQTPEQALAIARHIADAPGLRFEGLATYPPRGGLAAVEAFFAHAKDLLQAAGLPPRVLSNGGSPDFYQSAAVTLATEHRPGTYVYSDRMQAGFGLGTLDDCALTVLTTVVSRPAPDRAVLDAGSKALASDICAAPGYGHIREYPDAVITTLSEEHAVVDLSGCADKPAIGEKVRVIPNHVCVVSNLFDEVHFAENGEIVETLPVAARGRMA